MSDGKVSLEFLGEQMQRMQADLRDVRAGHSKMEVEQASMKADFRRIEAKVDSLDVKIDRLASSVDARFDQVQQTMTTHLEITIKAFSSLDDKIEKLASKDR